MCLFWQAHMGTWGPLGLRGGLLGLSLLVLAIVPLPFARGALCTVGNSGFASPYSVSTSAGLLNAAIAAWTGVDWFVFCTKAS
jgi:hypothetical protein